MSLRAKNRQGLRVVANLAAVLGIVLSFGGQALAAQVVGDQYPFFQVTGGDVATGAWFNNDSAQVDCLGSGYYQAPNWDTPTANGYKIGGIMSWVKGASRIGSHSQYGAQSLGLIEASGGLGYGFYTGNTAFNSLSFANFFSPAPTNSGFNNTISGGIFEGGPGHYKWHCIPDYYNDFLGNGTTPIDCAGITSITLGSSCSWSGKPTGTQFVDNPPAGSITTISAGGGTYSVPGGAGCKNYSLFVNGDVYLSANVSYAAHDATCIPRFALLVMGNIYVNPTETNLDGIYIAQPVTGSETTTGQFWSCHPNGSTPYSLAQLGTSCKGSTLTVNGSVIADLVGLTRVNGDVQGATPTPAEVFNYTPETAIGGSFTPPSAPGSTTGKIDSIVSLPPVY